MQQFFNSLTMIALVLSCTVMSTEMLNAQIDLDLSSPSFKPSVLQLSEKNQPGYLEFRLNKPVNSDIPVHGFKLKVELSNIKPINGVASIRGNGAEIFTWEYNEKENYLIGTQKEQIVGFLYSGTIGLDFMVTTNSRKKEPKNGFTATIYDVFDQYDLVKKNNTLSNFTWTQSDIRP